LLVVQAPEREVVAAAMARSVKVLVMALLILAMATEVQNIKTMDDIVVDLPALRPTRQRRDPGVRRPPNTGRSIPGFGNMLSGSSIPV
jgi:hypothetical protein